MFTVPAMGADVNGFRVWTDPDKTRAVLDLDQKTSYKLFTLKSPDRVVIDLKGSVNEFNLNIFKSGVRHFIR